MGRPDGTTAGWARVAAYDLPRRKATLVGVGMGVVFGVWIAMAGVILPDWLPLLAWLAAAMVLTVAAHEGIHGGVARLQGHRPIFGLKPPLVYVTFDEAIPRRHFMVVALAPLLVLDALFAVMYVTDVLPLLALLGLLVNTMGALGDLWMFWKLLPHPPDALVQDTKTGMEVWERAIATAGEGGKP